MIGIYSDEYVVYEDFHTKADIWLLHFIAYARRKFSDALKNDKTRAEHALEILQQLYTIEQRIQRETLSAEAILNLRQDEAIPVLKTLKDWMVVEYEKMFPESTIGQAISYCLARWEQLSIYITNAILQIDNNLAENVIRPVGIGRKNYLFAGSQEAAERVPIVNSLFATCRLHHITPYNCLKDVLEPMHLYITGNIAQLLPQYREKLEK